MEQWSIWKGHKLYLAKSGSDKQYWSAKGMCLYNVHPSNIKILNYDMKVFKPALEDHLSAHTSYSVEFFQLKVHN